MNLMPIIRQCLQSMIDRIDAGNSNLTEDQQIKALEFIQQMDDKRSMSKYSACEYLNISRAKFDQLVSEGKLPKGTHKQEFKELEWNKEALDAYVEKYK